jgi:hypothetical protein
MGETSGTIMRDASGNGRNGVISGGVILGRTGYSGLAYGFTGNGGLVTVPHSSALNPGSGSFTVSLYYKSSTLPSAGVVDYDLIRKGLGSTSGGDWKLEVLQNGHAFCHMRGSRSVDIEGTTNVVSGSWRKLSCTTNTSGTFLRVDGTTQRSTSSRPGSVTSTTSLLVGAKNTIEDSTVGSIDLVTISKT